MLLYILFSVKHFLGIVLCLLVCALGMRGQSHGLSADGFTLSEIPDSVWRLMQGKSYCDNPYVGREDLCYVRVLHCDYEGRTHSGEMIVGKKIAERVVEIFRLLYEARYPIKRMVLPDVYGADDEKQMQANNTSCFCFRKMTGGKKLSKHARGLAIDINPLYNPYCKVRRDGTRLVRPANAVRYCDRKKSFPYMVRRHDLAYKLFTERGFVWGGDWKSLKDYQHFELKE